MNISVPQEKQGKSKITRLGEGFKGLPLQSKSRFYCLVCKRNELHSDVRYDMPTE